MVVALALGACGADGSGGSAPSQRAPVADRAAPNIVAIVTDDQSLAQFNRRTMPETFRLLVDEGVTFDDFVVSTPLCCPSRATFLTGQYAHNNGVASNSYARLREKRNILPAWLQRAGYRTAHLGKYLNNFQNELPRRDAVPFGWDEWFTQLEPQRYYDYELAVNGGVRRYGTEPDDYLTRVLNRRAVELIEESANADEPLYLQLDHFAPHFDVGRAERNCQGGAPPDPDDRGLLAEVPDLAASRTHLAATRDRPWFLRDQPPLRAAERKRMRARYKCATASLRSVDRGVAQIVRTLERTGQLDRTALIFTSDNGAFYGEHRLRATKEFPYEEAVRVPLVVRLPDALRKVRGARVGAASANIDLAPTILELAGARPCIAPNRCREPDGRSLLPLASGERDDWPRERAILLHLDQPASSSRPYPRPCAYEAVRAGGRVLVRYRSAAPANGSCRARPALEQYDLERDPQQLRNLADPRHADARARRDRNKLRRALKRLRICRGSAADGAAPSADRPRCD